jgi:hypothetical protein
VAVLEVAEAAVDESGRTAGDAGAEVVFLDERHAVAGGGSGVGQSGAVDAAADEDQIVGIHGVCWVC